MAGPADAGPGEPAAAPVLPDGWRWESYRDAMVGVPGDWGHGGGGFTDWCADGPARTRPTVGRPGPVLGIKCPDGDGGVDPGTLVENAGTYVAFVSQERTDVTEGGDRILVRTDGVTDVAIQAEPGLRARIAATVHRITSADHHGCAVHHPIAADPAWRPAPVDISTLTEVDAVRACRYGGPPSQPDAGPTLSLASSRRLDGEETRTAVARVAAAKEGSGPNRPGTCSDGYGDEAIVLQALRGGTVAGEVLIRYSGCEHNGFDDGVIVRQLDSPSVTPFFAQPNRPGHYIGSRAMGEVMTPTTESK